MKALPLLLAALAFASLLPAQDTKAPPAPPAPPPIKAGFADRDITPEIGMEKPGGYGKSYIKSIHDPCKVRAAVFDDGSRRVAIVGIDALIIRRAQVAAVRKAVHAATGIAPEAILIGASHSHSSGPTGMILPGEFDHASEQVQVLAYEKSSTADPVYLQLVEKQLIAAIVAANDSRVEVHVGVGSGIEDKVSFNRRFHMKNGITATHPRYGNPEMLKPAGPIDPEVGVIGAWDKEGKLIGCVVTFACHATTSPGGASANYIYYVERAIRNMMEDQELPVVFVNGASADITQVNNRDPFGRVSGADSAVLVGGCVGAEACKILLRTKRMRTLPVDFRLQTLEIPRRPPSPERVAKCREIVSKDPEPGMGRSRWTFSKEIVLLDALMESTPVSDVEIQAVKVGPAVFITTPAEYFTQFGLDQKSAVHFPFTWPVSLANGCVGYVPTEEALGPNGGGYETRLTSYSNLVPSAGRLMANTGIDLANDMHPGPLPRPAKQLAPGATWDYGSHPPELE